MSATFPIFVGSTFTDLAAHRKAVFAALQRLENVVRGMEHFGSLSGTPKDECLRIVRGCRAYIGIFAMRYGALDLETGKSLTQLEYEEAKRYRLPTLIYLIDEDRQPVLPKYIDFGESGEKLKSLKEKLKHNHVVSFFTTPDDLAMKVTQDLSDLLQQQGANVEKGALAKIVESLPKVDWLDDKRFAFLKERIGNLADPIGSDEILHEALQFLLMDDRLSAVFLIAQSTGLNIRQSIDLMLKVHVIVLTVALEGYRKMENNGEVPSGFLTAFEAHVLRTRDSLEVIETGKRNRSLHEWQQKR